MKVEAYHGCLPLKNKFKRLGWNVCTLLFFRPSVGPLSWRWCNLLLRLSGAAIGKGSKASALAKMWASWNLEIGEYVAISVGTNCCDPGEIVLDSKMVVSQGTYLYATSHDITDPLDPLVATPTHIGSLAWIAAEAFVNVGIAIGEGVVVGARAAISKNVDPWTIVGGNPVKFIKKRVTKE